MKLLDATLQVGIPIDNVAEWCRVNGVSERTFQRHRARVIAEGAWIERSRRPHRSPAATPDWLVELVVALRTELAPDNGADHIHAALPQAIKVRATAARIL